MIELNGKKYIAGTLDISPAALERLNEMGVKPPFNPYESGGTYDSFYLPEGEDGSEFGELAGSPAKEGYLYLKGEKVTSCLDQDDADQDQDDADQDRFITDSDVCNELIESYINGNISWVREQMIEKNIPFALLYERYTHYAEANGYNLLMFVKRLTA